MIGVLPSACGTQRLIDARLNQWTRQHNNLEHPEAGKRVLPGLPVKFSAVPKFNYATPPDLGQHNREVFGELLGLADDVIAKLVDEKVIY